MRRGCSELSAWCALDDQQLLHRGIAYPRRRCFKPVDLLPSRSQGEPSTHVREAMLIQVLHCPYCGSVSKVEMVTPMSLIYKVLFPSISTFETPPSLQEVLLYRVPPWP